MTNTRFDVDLFTIGGGSGGVRASRFAAQYGARVALAERHKLGGTCVNAGCIPKKLMSYAAHYRDDLAHAPAYGWDVGPAAFDWKTLLRNKDAEISRLNGVYRSLLEKSGVTVHEGNAVIEDPHTVNIDGKRVTARHILVATGGRPSVPEITGKALGIVSDDFFHLDDVPKRTVIAGGGYIAVELAAILNGLGSQVTLVHRGARLLRAMDADIGSFLGKEMEKKGIAIKGGTVIASLASDGQGIRRALLDNGETLDAEAVLFATGRVPNTEGLGLENVGVRLSERGAIKVDANFTTSVPSIHAVGDVIDRVALTPVALAEGMVVASLLFCDGARKLSYENIPTAVFSHPNVGTVGLTEATARERHAKVRVFKSEFTALKHTISGASERVMMKLVVDEASDRVLGVHMVGADAGEIIQGFAVALQCGATKAQFDATIGIHPTIAEEFVTMRG
ncbi:MAG TPA: glutathione-disulfide reductase [Noviherbaspirillum sp.]|nr:glutathione-disulfide reductase [Noviherbaspirillum sp.]